MKKMMTILIVTTLYINMVDMKHLLVEVEGLIVILVKFCSWFFMFLFSDSPPKMNENSAGDYAGIVNPRDRPGNNSTPTGHLIR